MLALLVFPACGGPVETVESTGIIIVEVLDQDETFVEGIPVSIWTPELSKFTGMTGADGKYRQVVPAPWHYRVLPEVHGHTEESCFVGEDETSSCPVDIVTFVPNRPVFYSAERFGTDSVIKLVWNTPWDGGLGGNGLEGYMIERKIAGETRDTLVAHNGSGVDTMFTYEHAVDSLKYQFWVSAINYRGISLARRKTVQPDTIDG